MARTLIHLPQAAKRGDAVEVRTLIQHPMETGYRPGPDGRPLPRDLVRRFSCHLGVELVFAAELFPAVAANPYLAFTLRAERSGTLVFVWEGDNGFVARETRAFVVT